MTSIRIWTVESDYDTKVLKSLVNRLASDLKLGDLSVQTAGSKAFPMPNGSSESLNGNLKKAVRHYLKQDDYVIFIVNSQESMMKCHQRQKSGALVKQIKQVVADPGFAGKVFLASGVPELEARLWRVHLGITAPAQAARMDYAEAQFRKLCASRGLDWDTMTETERESFIDDLIHEDRECVQ